MKTIIITVGNEVASGHTINTNAAWIAQSLEIIGVTPDKVLTVRDDVKTLVREIRAAVRGFDVVLITGGLGPTPDDVTKPALVKAFNTRLARDKATLRRVRRFFRKINRPMAPVNEGQADVPEGCQVIANRWGTAPCLYFDTGGCMLFALPGVPYEMKNLMRSEVIRRLGKRAPKTAIRRTVLRTIGVGESALYTMIEASGWVDDEVELAYLPHFGQVDIRLTASGKTMAAARARLNRAAGELLRIVGPYCFGRDDESLEAVVGRILVEKKLTLACAESCTGGLFASRITSVPGSSAYFLEGAVTYSNEAKISRLGVNEATLREYGAVSPQAASEMAQGVRVTSGADIGVSATGVAGPTGGTKEKPVGLVYLALSHDDVVETKELRLGMERSQNQDRAVKEMMTMLWRAILDI